MVRRLHARLGKATPVGRGGRVRARQRLLAQAFSAKVFAVKRVTDTPGKQTVGVDQSRGDTPAKHAMAVSTVRQPGDRAAPLRRVSLPKSGGTGRRPRSIPCRQDRARQALSLRGLDPIAATLAEPKA